MADPTLEEVAKGWALWVAADIIDDIEDRDLVPGGYLDDIRECIVMHLTDVAIANACRVPPPIAPSERTKL